MKRKNKAFDIKDIFERIADYIKENPTIVALMAVASILVVVAIAVVVMLFTSGGGDVSSSLSSSSSDSYDSEGGKIDEEVYSDVILQQSELLDPDYLEETLFIGDSNTYRLINFDHTTLQNNVSFVSMGINGAVNEEGVYFRDRDDPVSIAESVSILQPRRVIITFGTNDAATTSVDDFIESYSELIDDIRFYYPSVDIIINTVPPVTKNREYNNISMTDIDRLNNALVELARDMNCMFLNSAEALKDSSGYGDSDFFVTDGIHISEEGAEEFINYVLMHSYITDDDRPDLKAIPVRYEKAPQVIPSSSSSSSSSSADGIEVQFVTNHSSYGRIEGEATQIIEIGASATTVVAVAEDGYAFSHWTVTNGRIEDINNPSLTFTVPDNADGGIIATAHFIEDDGSSSSSANTEVKVTFSVSDTKHGGINVTGEKSYKLGDTITATATPAAGYEFDYWTDTSGTVNASKNLTFSFEVTEEILAKGSILIRANFKVESAEAEDITVNFSSSNPAQGTVSPASQLVKPGNSATATAIALEGFEFTHWSIGGGSISTSATINYTVPEGTTEDITVTAHFTAKTPEVQPVTATFASNDAAQGSVSGAAQTVNPGQIVTATAAANAGYQFSHWTFGGTNISSTAALSFTIPMGTVGDVVIIAHFVPVADSSSSSTPSETP